MNQDSSATDSFSIEMNIVIPHYRTDNVPYGELESVQGIELLEANGIKSTSDELAKARFHPNDLIRGTVYYLLSCRPSESDKAIFMQGIDDSDEMVQISSAIGLFKLGDSTRLALVRKIARSDVEMHLEATRAAGVLAELGDPSAFPTLAKAFESNFDYVRLFGARNLWYFVPHHGKNYAPDQSIDIWHFYKKALKDTTPEIRNIAKMQLKSLSSEEAQQLLKNN